MKTALTFALSLASTLLTSCASPDSASVGATLMRYIDLTESGVVYDVLNNQPLMIEPGSSKALVLHGCGRPTQEISENLWVYQNSHSTASLESSERFDALVVAFQLDRVVGLKLVNGDELEAALRYYRNTDSPRPTRETFESQPPGLAIRKK